jgi:hypothetical protein
MGSLAEAINKASADLVKTKKSLVFAYESTLYDIGESLVFFTPIKTGLASSNWNVSFVGHIPTERGIQSGIKGKASLDAISGQVKNMKVGKTALFSNPVDYIDDLEDGTSRQAPAGMVQPTKYRIEGIWLKNLKKFNVI